VQDEDVRGSGVCIGFSDLVGHSHELIVFGDGGRLVMVFPPAETAVLAGPQVRQLGAVLVPRAGGGG
jgi:hypothetical protein